MQVAEVLHKTMEQLAAVQALAEQRAPLLAAIAALDACLAEVAWMRAWKQDSQRFSVRAPCPGRPCWLASLPGAASGARGRSVGGAHHADTGNGMRLADHPASGMPSDRPCWLQTRRDAMQGCRRQA